MRELYKRVKLRLRIWIAGLIVLLLIDEYIKEGYLFKLSDVFCIGTHENIISMLIIAWIIAEIFICRRR